MLSLGTCPASLVATLQSVADQLPIAALLRLLVAYEHLDLDAHADATLRFTRLLDDPDRLELPPGDCARAVGAAARLPDAPLRHDALVALIRRNAGAMTSDDIGRTILALAKYPAARSDGLLAIHELESRLSADQLLQPAVLSNLAASYAHDSGDRMRERLPVLLTAASHRLSDFSASHLELLLYALARTQANPRPASDTARLLDRCVARLEIFATQLLPGPISSVLWSLATLGATPARSGSLLALLSLRLADFLRAARDMLVCFSVHQLATCLWAFAVLGHRPQNLSAMIEVAARLSDRYPYPVLPPAFPAVVREMEPTASSATEFTRRGIVRIAAEDCSKLLWAVARLDFEPAELVQARSPAHGAAFAAVLSGRMLPVPGAACRSCAHVFPSLAHAGYSPRLPLGALDPNVSARVPPGCA